MGKIKLSHTLKFFSDQLNKIAGSEFELEITLHDDNVPAGQPLHAEARLIASNNRHRTLDYLEIRVAGQIQQDGRWQTYTQSARIAHETPLPPDKIIIVPIVINIPQNAVLSEDGANWTLRIQAIIDRTIDPRIEAPFQVLTTLPSP